MTTSSAANITNDEVDFSKYDQDQVEFMKEACIILDENDKPIGRASKKTCNVFLFNSKNELLLQQRASEKITFPDCFTNTCCSHPLHIESELVEEDQLGVRRAAQRKLLQELGIRPEQVPLDKFVYLTRIHYKAPSDGLWGEHEIDYILFIKADVDLDINPNEVQSTKYVTKEELKEMIATANEKGVKITPWFSLIDKTLLYKWWDNLDDIESQKDHKTIHRF
ncbi:isopentenyl-diphosphate delta-isomerase idi1 [Mycoemilia scoparia]|uniref:isopentenyl-diphosphate Delta-isomerase n=1 Tax=Mycoemilia scoparia TaxID=417184 RepID=A0A9W8DQS4_9FUNG|nr:isopentenyl-diphosphate delta-isomerase idi1 [Mycoemilia scoparia]